MPFIAFHLWNFIFFFYSGLRVLYFSFLSILKTGFLSPFSHPVKLVFARRLPRVRSLQLCTNEGKHLNAGIDRNWFQTQPLNLEPYLIETCFSLLATSRHQLCHLPANFLPVRLLNSSYLCQFLWSIGGSDVDASMRVRTVRHFAGKSFPAWLLSIFIDYIFLPAGDYDARI